MRIGPYEPNDEGQPAGEEADAEGHVRRQDHRVAVTARAAPDGQLASALGENAAALRGLERLRERELPEVEGASDDDAAYSAVP